MPIIRVTALFDHANGLPRDTAANTFHFLGDIAAADEVATDVVEMYANDLASGNNLGDWFSPQYSGVRAKAYIVQDAIVDGVLVSNSGEPIVETLTSLFPAVGARKSASGLPSEVACCVTMRATQVPNVPKPRRTGRVYVGPLNQAAQNNAMAVEARPAVAFTADLRAAVDRMQAAAFGHGGTLVVYSRPFPGRPLTERPNRAPLRALPARPDGATYVVDQVWTDDAFDTQRRRGERPTAKTLLAL